MIAFDSQGALLFNNTDNAPELNGSDSYSDVSNISEVEQLKSSVSDGEVLSAKNEDVGFSSGRPSDDEYGYVVYYPQISIFLEYTGVAKIAFTINYDDSIAESDRVISSIKINGQIYTNTYLFKDSTEDLDVSSSIEVDTDSLSSLVGGGSSISELEITLKNSNLYKLSVSSEIIFQSGVLYSYTLSLRPESLTVNNTTIGELENANTDSTIGFSSTTDSTK